MALVHWQGRGIWGPPNHGCWVCRNSIKDWYNNYEHFNQYVVPRSSDTITEDPEYYLVTVTVMKKIVEEFKQKARESK